MRRLMSHPLTVVVLVIAGLYVLFAYLIQPPLPRSLLSQFMVYSVIGVLMVATFDDAACKRLFEPIQALLGSPALRIWRTVAFFAVVLGASALTYQGVKPSLKAPVELRAVHPAPPSTFRAYGRGYDPVKLQNPLRKGAPKGSDAYRALIQEGRALYYKNCLHCHGDMLDGQGHFAAAFNPRPANFQDVGTIAQLQESFLFWRITTGGPGLPREGAPWASAMPVWHELLEEEEVWKIIMFLYDYTGFEPRSWELGEQGGAPPSGVEPGKADSGAERAAEDGAGEAAIRHVYRKRCSQCHGKEGAGDGPAAEFLYPKPRDFTLGVFKYKTTEADSEFPSDDDLRKTIREGLPGTSMLAWRGVLSDAEIDGLIKLIKTFGDWQEEELELKPIDAGEQVPSSPESIARGAKLFEKACVQCHGAAGRGNVPSGKKLKDDWGDRIWPRNLSRPETWRWTRDAKDVFQRISTGIRGTPMPEHTKSMSVQDRWDVANYAMTLRKNAVPLTQGVTVVHGARIKGAVPSDPDDPAWRRATPITFPLAPNIIKEPRLYYSLNDTITVRVLFNDEALGIRLDVDDRTYSVPGHEEERRYALAGIKATPDAVAVQFPAEIPTTSEKPWFRHGDAKHPVSMWYWRAPSVEPARPQQVALLDGAGPDKPPAPRENAGGLGGMGVWQDGQWRVVFTRGLKTDEVRDIQFEIGRYIPIAFANWDGWAGQSGGRHTLTTWYWLLLPPEERPLLVYGTPGGAGLLAAVLFLGAARRQRNRRTGQQA
ncbi:MAG: c-type cytochrome [Alphaproteobacteria bacterium]